MTVHAQDGPVDYAAISDAYIARCTCGTPFIAWTSEDALNRLLDHLQNSWKATP